MVMMLHTTLLINFLAIITITTAIPVDLSKRVLITEDLTYQECDSRTNSEVSGAYLFDKAGISSTVSIQSMTLTGWIFPKGYRPGWHTIFQVRDSTYGQIYIFSYDPSQIKFKHTLKTTSRDCTISPASAMIDRWYFYRIKISLDISYTLDIVDIIIQSEAGVTINCGTTLTHSGGLANQFNKSDVSFSFGNESLNFDLSSCAIVKNVVLYLNEQPTLDSVVFYHRKSAILANIRQHYDFFYLKSTPNTLLNPYKSFNRITSPLLTYSSASGAQIQPSSDGLCLDEIFTDPYNGFIVYFEFKAISDVEIFRLVWMGTLIVKIRISSTNQLLYKCNTNAEDDFGTLTPSELGQWYSAAIIVSVFMQRKVTAFINYNGVVLKEYTLPWFNQGVQACFGDSATPIEIDNIRIYDGTMVGETTECLVHTVGKLQDECLFCQPAHVLDYKDKPTCKVPPTGTTVSRFPLNVVDWNLSDCDAEMIHLNQSSSCTCQYSWYKTTNKCKKCPRFCKVCTEIDICQLKDPLRNVSSGECTSGFDDGYNCIPQTFMIPLRTNIFRNIENGGMKYQIIGQSEIIAPSGGISPFFVTAWFASINEAGIFSRCLFTFTDNSAEKITGILLRYAVSDPPILTFCFSGGDNYQFTINANYPLQIGLWFSQTKQILIVQNNGQFIYRTFNANLIPSSVYTNPVICIGSCATVLNFVPTPSPLVISDPLNYLKFYRGMSDPSSMMDDLLNLMCEKSEFYADFTFEWDSSTYKPLTALKVFTPLISKQSLYVLNLPTPLATKAVTHLFKGVAWKANGITILNDVPSTREFAMSLNVFIEKLDNKFTFLIYKIGTTIDVQYFLIPDPSSNQVILLTCFRLQCKELKECPIYMNEPNFLVIIVRFKNLVAQNTEFHIVVEAVCNYQREKYRFPFTESVDHIKLSYFQVWSTGITSVVFLNNLRLMSGSDFYFDYTIADNCFLYFDSIGMKCLKAKKDYVLRNYKPILESECYSLTNQSVVMVNPYTQECFDTKVYMPYCKTIDHTATCTKCIDPNAEPTLQCACKDGFYFSLQATTCQPCSPQCLTCVDTSNTCVECKSLGTDPPPSCLCSDPSQYTHIDFSCKDCDSKCGTCQTNSNLCLTCAVDRIDPPNCACNPMHFDPFLSDAFTCVPYICSSQCQTCSTSASTCLTCTQNRVNPPICACPPGFIELGTPPICECPSGQFEVNSTCQSCGTHTYFNSNSNQCSTCNSNCSDCMNEGYTCTSCVADSFLDLTTKQCLCSGTFQPVIVNPDTGLTTCAQFMNTLLITSLVNEKYVLTFKFEYPLEYFDMNVDNINQIFFIYFTSVPSTAYYISTVELRETQLLLTLTFTETFKAQTGYVQFLMTKPFLSSQFQRALDPKYLDLPFEFQIGPLIIADEIKSNSPTLSAISSALRDSGAFINLVSQFQVILYVLNTLQPSSMFLLVNVIVPPNLYQFLQITGLFVFPNVTDYGVTNNLNQISVFGYTGLEKNVDYDPNKSYIFRQLGFSNSIILSIPIAACLFLLWHLVYLAMIVRPDYILVNSKSLVKRSESKITNFVWSRIISGCETGILIFTSTCVNQFKNISQEMFWNRVSVYLCTFFMLGYIIHIIYTYRMLFRPTLPKPTPQMNKQSYYQKPIILNHRIIAFNQTQSSEADPESHLKNIYECKDEINENRNQEVVNDADDKESMKTLSENPPLKVLEKYKGEINHRTAKKYYCFQLFKKLLFGFIIVGLEDFPNLLCGIAAIISLISLALSIYIRPYKHFMSNAAKIITETCLLLIWIVYLSVFIPMNTELEAKITIPKEQVETFQQFGFIALLAIFALNVMYFLEFLFVQVINRIINLRKTPN